jgi:hypothetical protein
MRVSGAEVVVMRFILLAIGFLEFVDLIPLSSARKDKKSGIGRRDNRKTRRHQDMTYLSEHSIPLVSTVIY